MATLHLVNHPSALPSCLEAARDGDTILLLEDGVYAAASGAPERPLHAIDIDVTARGLAERLHENVTLASYQEFVQLVENHQPIVSWR
ncbi:MAG: sulfurtransferase complex subunit TusB [Pseudomonadales bacterium]|nr:sulfurtransferase complex subunit TusB [Pseudomonadales bacterium]NIX08882.1 sulfurtransferase complex subunit TusB [Pseudomonadales bacterium]